MSELDPKRLRLGELVAGASAALLLVLMFAVPWYGLTSNLSAYFTTVVRVRSSRCADHRRAVRAEYLPAVGPGRSGQWVRSALGSGSWPG